MNLKDFTEGLNIISKYYDNPEGYHLGADHDVVYIYPTDRPIPYNDISRLRKLAFAQEGGEDAEYDPDGSWWAYV